jgi:LPXTG-site transpeptidase (sortase) family protein
MRSTLPHPTNRTAGRRRPAGRLLVGILVTGLLAGCGAGATEIAVSTDPAEGARLGTAGDDRGVDLAGAIAAEATDTPDPSSTPSSTTSTVPVSPLAALVRPLPSAAYDPTEHQVAIPPVRVSIEGVGATDVPVRAVGLEPNGEMEIPPESEVGWYRNSPSPGDAGSSVLAGHIAFDGRPGAFRNLADTEVGALVEVTLLDGTTRSFRVTAVQQFAKDELPDELFRTDGLPILTLITCGGTFQRSLGSYDSNIVVTAVPA